MYNERGQLVIWDEDGTQQYPSPDTRLYKGNGKTIFDDLKELNKVTITEYYKGNSESPFNNLRFVPKGGFVRVGINGETIKIPKREFHDFVLNLRRLEISLGIAQREAKKK